MRYRKAGFVTAIMIGAILAPHFSLHAETRTFVSDNVLKPINDNQSLTSSIIVAEMSPYITNVTVGLEDIDHTCDQDLKIYLISPAGTRVELLSAVGGTDDDFTGTVLDESAPTHITSGVAPFTGSFQPCQSLAKLQSENPNGTWKLQITDTAAPNTGMLNSWSLTISAGRPLDWMIAPISIPQNKSINARVSGQYVVWQADDGNDWEIFCHNTATNTTVAVTDNTSDDRYPQTNGRYIVWENYNGGDAELFLYDLIAQTTTRLTNNDYDDCFAQINGSIVVWCAQDNGDSEIYLYDITEAQVAKITTNTWDDIAPCISSPYVVWEAYYTPAPEIMLYNCDTKAITRLTENDYVDWTPHVDGSTVVWCGFDGNDPEIFMYDANTALTRKITNNGYPDSYPLTNGTHVAWCGNDRGDDEIFLYDIKTQIITRITENAEDDSYPEITGQNVAWHRSVNGDDEVFIYNITTAQTLRVTETDHDDRYATVCGSNLAWETHEETTQVWLAERTVCMSLMSADIDGNCQVDFNDFAAWAAQWMTCDLQPPDGCWR